MSGKAFRGVLVLAAGLSIVATACAPTSTPGGSPAATAAGTAAGTAAATAAIPRGGTFIFAMWQEPATLAGPYVNQTIAGLVAQTVVEGLAMTDNDGNYVPMLAKTVPTLQNGGVKLSADGKKMDVTWELKPGIKWSDGQPLTSADIRFTWETWMKDPKVVNRAGHSDIESIDTPNELTAVVHYKVVYAAYTLNFGWILPKHVLQGVEDISKNDFNRKPIGTGPFKVTEFVAGDHITVERNPNYREAGKPYLDKIIFKSVPSREVGIAQIKAGEVHGLWNLLEAQIPDLEKEPNVKLIVWPSSSVERIELNLAQNKDATDPASVHPVLGDIAVRKAVLWAAPKQQIVDKLLGGKPKVAQSGYSQGWAAYKGQQDGYDPAKANAELDKAGWAKGADGIRSKGGVKASLTFLTTTGDKIREQIQQVLVDEWKKIGIEVKIQNQPSSVFLSGNFDNDPRKRGTFDLNMYATSPGIDPHTHIFTRFHSSQVPSASNKAGQNYLRLKSPEVDQAIDQGVSTVDLEKRKAAYATAIKAINDSYAIIFLYERSNIDAHRPNVGGWKGHTWDNVTWNTQDWFLKP